MLKKKHKKARYQSWHGYLVLAVVFIALVLGIVERITERVKPPVAEAVLTEETCSAAGGNWNTCASACRGLPDEVPCIELCVEQCECTMEDQCPFGYSCADYIDNVGVCLNSS